MSVIKIMPVILPENFHLANLFLVLFKNLSNKLVTSLPC
ncbi:hypothetical protein AO372_1132 [Moraxella catarrhalis]|nr:hypothetical protein AO381_0768 [Moraxella catarrhalis]OAV21218.1 hypothetical protein AO372_1132 [Moraxella catarrhalis]